jgi:hypothetical protein
MLVVFLLIVKHSVACFTSRVLQNQNDDPTEPLLKNSLCIAHTSIPHHRSLRTCPGFQRDDFRVCPQRVNSLQDGYFPYYYFLAGYCMD